jgi:hypothetical protein
MGFKTVKKLIIQKIRSKQIQHEQRIDSYKKNLYAHGLVSDAEVIALISICRGNDYKVEPLHADRSIDVHFFRPLKEGVKWYIKVYMLEPDAWFISVHR